MEEYYRDDPKNTPHTIDGDPIGGGPWLRAQVQADFAADCTYGSNNGMISAACREDGDPEDKVSLFVAPYTNLNEKLLAQSGFRPTGLYVPFSNGESGKTPHEQQFLKEIEHGQLRGRTPITTTMRMYKATGAQYKDTEDGPIKTVPVITDSRYLGTYNVSPTNILAIVDLEGVVHITRNSASIREDLDKQSFRRMRSLDVPFAKGEKPVMPKFCTNQDVESFVVDVQKEAAYRRGLQSKAVGG